MLRFKIGRNTKCLCGSDKKYKICCMSRRNIFKKIIKHGVKVKNKKEIKGINDAGRLVVRTLDFVESKLSPGISTDFINDIVHKFTIKHGAIPAQLNYHGYPKSVCVSVNEVVCHGIPGSRILMDGDIINVDVTSIIDGYYADASKSFYIGTPGSEAKHVVNIARQSLLMGMNMVKPGNTTADIGKAIQDYAESEGCSVVREFVGHGVGLGFHEPPQIIHYYQSDEDITLLPNMIFTIEPMINLGEKNVNILPDGWTVVTFDNSLSAQFEQTICVTDDGCKSLTPYML